METIRLQVLAKVSLLIVLYILVYYTFFAFISKPGEGDSIDYHIPIAQMILNGSIVNAQTLSHVNLMRYSPGSSEVILSFFIFFHLPLNLYNVFALLVLLFVLYYLARNFGLSKNYAIIFSATFCTIHTVDRWLTAQTIDIWLAIFFSLTYMLLQKPERSTKYFLKLGLASGMLVGTKFTGPLFFIILCIFFLKNVLRYITVFRFFIFFIPFSLIGLSWYGRNYLFTGDPYFPQSIPFFKGHEWHIFDMAVWKIIFLYHTGFTRTLNAFISEYTIWIFALPLSIIFLVYGYKKINILILVGLLNFFIYFFLPSGPYDNLMVTGFRYTYPAFIPLILSIFIVAQKFGKSELLAVISVINMIMLTEMSYRPKIVLLFLPAGLLLYFWDRLPIQFFHQKK